MASQTSGEAHHSECNFVSASIPHFLMHYMGETAPPDTPKNKRNRRLRTTDPKIIIANGTNFKDLVLLHTAMLCHPTSLHDPEHLASPTGPLENSCTAIGSPSSSNTEEFSESPYHYIGNKPTFHTAGAISADDFSKLQSLTALLDSESHNIDEALENINMYNDIMDSFQQICEGAAPHNLNAI